MSALMDWLFDKTPGIEDAPPPCHHITGLSLISDHDDLLEPPATSYDLDEVFTVIDYRDAKGNPSRRRITMRSVGQGPQAPILKAICHERRALRAFRCDRIEGFIEEHGEVIECDRFFREFLMIDLGILAKSGEAAREGENAKARAVRDRLRAPLSILVAIARSDDDFLPEELDAICSFAKSFSSEAGSLMAELRPLIQKMRPSKEALPNHLQIVEYMARNPDFAELFGDAVNEVIWADGQISRGEYVLLSQLGLATT